MNKLSIAVIIKREASNPKHEHIHQRSIQLIEKAIQKYNLAYKISSRHLLNTTKNADLIVSVGGDGTFLHTSHLLQKNQILMGVNSVPKASHGAYCLCDAKDFEKKLELFLKGKLKITKLFRLQLKINGKKVLPYALNDILFCHPCPAGTSRYEIKVGNKKEDHKSSGVWISTASGSTAAIRSAGGKIFKAGSDQFQFVIREPFLQQKKTMTLKQGLLEKKQKLILIPHMPVADVFIDGSHHQLKLKHQDRFEVEISPETISALIR